MPIPRAGRRAGAVRFVVAGFVDHLDAGRVGQRRSASATSSAWARDSIAQGPAISTNGSWLPISIAPTRTTRGTIR